MEIKRKTKGGGKLQVWVDGADIYIRETSQRGKQVDTVSLSVEEFAKVTAYVGQETGDVK